MNELTEKDPSLNMIADNSLEAARKRVAPDWMMREIEILLKDHEEWEKEIQNDTQDQVNFNIKDKQP